MSGFRLPLPTKDDVALVDGVPLTLSMFAELRARLGKDGSVENTFRLGVGSIATRNAAAKRGLSLDPEASIRVVSYALGHASADDAAAALSVLWPKGAPPPADALRQVDEWVAAALVQRNPQALTALQQ